MPNLNKVMLMGNVCAVPEATSTPQGTQITNLRLAINRKTKEGSDTTFIDVTSFGRTAEIAAQYLGKGHPVLIEGRLVMDTWTDKQGQTRIKHKVIAENIQLLGSKGDNQQQQGGYQQNYQQTQKQNNFTGGCSGQQSSYSRQGTNTNAPNVNDDDIPF